MPTIRGSGRKQRKRGDMTSSDQAIRQQAEALYEERLEELREQAEREQEAEREQGIQGAIRELKKQRSEERREEARREAAQEAESLSHELHDLGTKLHAHAAELRGRLLDATRRAGQEVDGRSAWIGSVLPSWVRGVFGGRGSIVGVPHELAGTAGRGQDRGPRSLPERDSLAAPRTNSDV